MSPLNASIAFSLLLTLVFVGSLVSFLTDYEAGKCEMTYMFEYPQFVRISHDADFKYKKYGLYAYGEGRTTEKARNMIFDGIPVLFIPGSGGSHKQCRSFASIALRKALNSRTRFHFDYFTADLNNELSGLNGALLDSQLEYVNSSIYTILGLYKGQHAQKRIILIGHSMGGVLAKAIISKLPSTSELIPIVVALSAPVKRPVVALDYFFDRFYTRMNDNFEPPASTAFITVAGGFNDFLVPPHLTEGGHLHTVATQVPKCWVSSDHVSVVWCKQLVLAINRALFESVDPTTLRVYNDRETILRVFYHHLVAHSGTKVHESHKYAHDVQLTHNGQWYEGKDKQYSVRLPKGSSEMRWFIIPLVMKPLYEHLTLVGLNVKAVDWVYVCTANVIRNNQRLCETGHHLSHLAEIAPSLRHKRRTLRINLHDLKMNYTKATHVAVRLLPTYDYTALHIDVTDPDGRHLIFNYGASFISFSPKEVLARTEVKAVHYDILLPQFTQLIQSYTLYLDGVCSGTGHHATATLIIPWNHHEVHKFYTDALKKPMTFKLYKARPVDSNEYASIRLTLDPTCRYRISMTNDYDYGMMARFYTPMLISNVAAVLLMTLRSQLNHMAENERCSFIFTAMKEGVKPYYVVTSVKILSRVLAFQVPLIGPSDSLVLIDENIDILFLPLVLYSISVGVVWLGSVGLSVGLICFESTFHKLGVKFFTRTFAGRVGWTDHVMKAFDKIPGVVACVLIAMSYTTCGALAVCLATIFYFLKLTQMAQDLIEDLVKGVAKSIAYKLRDKIWDKVKRRWFGKRRTQNETLSIKDDQSKLLNAGETDTDQPGTSGLGPIKHGDQKDAPKEDDDDEDDFERPMEIEIKAPDNSEGVTKVDGDKLVELLNTRMTDAPSHVAQGENAEGSFFSRVNFSIVWLKEAIENNEIFFHFTMFLIYLVVAVLNIPSVLTWARNYKYSKSLDPDPVFLPALILSACAAPLWQFEFPRVEKKFYAEVSKMIFIATILVLTFGVISIYRISFILSGVVAIVTLHQIIAPDKPSVESEALLGPPDVPDDDKSANVEENDSYSERVKAKWE